MARLISDATCFACGSSDMLVGFVLSFLMVAPEGQVVVWQSLFELIARSAMWSVLKELCEACRTTATGQDSSRPSPRAAGDRLTTGYISSVLW
jgi:hypothetical protein